MDLGLTDRVALVTGASKGIGRAIATELITEGAKVAISSRTAPSIQQTAREIGAAHAATWDSADVDGAAGLVDEVEGAVGPVDVLVLNTGGPPLHEDALHFGRAEWQAAYESLVLSQMALLERVLPGMRERSFGRILNIVSITVVEPLPSVMLSVTHRSSMIAAFKTLGRQVAGDGVTLNSILPGRIATAALIDNYPSLDAARAAAEAEVPVGRLGDPAELAALATFLCSNRAGYITGARIAVDGGVLRSI